MGILCPALSRIVIAVALIGWMAFSVEPCVLGQSIGANLDGLADVEFPSSDSVINVKLPPYNAKGDGLADDTQAIQMAIDDLMGQHRILYFPEGEYLVSKTIRWSKKHSSGSDAWGHNWLQGKSPSKTTIRLKDGVFTDSKNPQSIMWCGGFGSADWFHNYIEGLTFDIGKNNAGAIALQFYSNNYGAVRNCRFVDRTSQAAMGLDLSYGDMNGPLLVKNCEVDGFRIGIKTGHAVNSQTFEYLSLINQSEAGFVNEGQAISVRRLLSRSQVPAVKTYGTLAMIDSSLEGLPGAERHPSVLNFNSGHIFIRDLRTTGYQRAIVSLQTPDQSAAYRLESDQQREGVGPNIGTYSSERPFSVFESQNPYKPLPVVEPPEVNQDPASKWANVVDFGADPTGDRDSAGAIQRAVDSGASTVFLPGFFRIESTIEVRGNVSRILGTGGWVDYNQQASPDFRVVDGSSPSVHIEHLSSINGGIEVDTSRTVTFNSLGTKRMWFTDKARGGKLFFEDVTTNNLELNEQQIWARQLNVENEGLHISNRASDLWILGYKTERGGTLLRTSNGGRSEVLGGFSYTTTAGDLAPMFVTEDASVFAFFGEVCYTGNPFKTIITERRQGKERSVVRGAGETLPYVTGSMRSP